MRLDLIQGCRGEPQKLEWFKTQAGDQNYMTGPSPALCKADTPWCPSSQDHLNDTVQPGLWGGL